MVDDNIEVQIQSLERRIAELESRRPSAADVKTNLISPNFLIRAFTVWGHNAVAELIIAIPFILMMLIIAGMAGLLR
jgi:hypothetical protein